jgi:hypothetical protein
MTPKEKAEELVNNMCDTYDPDCTGYVITFAHAKQCALIAVDEMLQIQSITMYPVIEENYIYGHKDYWQEVKQEIEKL